MQYGQGGCTSCMFLFMFFKFHLDSKLKESAYLVGQLGTFMSKLLVVRLAIEDLTRKNDVIPI